MNDDDSTNQFSAREVWDNDGVHVSVRNTSTGGVQFEIRNLNSNLSSDSDREYAIRVSGDDTWDLISALGPQSNEPVDLVEANIETIMQTGVTAWLESIGIDAGRRHAATSHAPLFIATTPTADESNLGNSTDHNRTRKVWGKNGLFVSISRTVNGGVRFEGQDTNPNPFGDSDYEYALTVSRGHVPKIIEALGGESDANPLDLIEADIETIVRIGEMEWLKSHGIDASFWSYP